MFTVQDLRDNGVRVRVTHYRRFANPNGTIECLPQSMIVDRLGLLDVMAKGGKTVVTINVRGIDFTGTAHCSKEDGYNKKKGVKEALQRAMINLAWDTVKHGGPNVLDID